MSRDGKQEKLLCADERQFGLTQWFSKYGPRLSLRILQDQNYLSCVDICTIGG